MSHNENTLIAENIIQIFKNNLKFIDLNCVRKVFYKLIEKDKNQEMGLNHMIENVLEESYDMSDLSNSYDEKRSPSISPSIFDSPNYSDDENSLSLTDSLDDDYLTFGKIADDIFVLIIALDEKDIEDILLQVKNYFMTKSNYMY